MDRVMAATMAGRAALLIQRRLSTRRRPMLRSPMASTRGSR